MSDETDPRRVVERFMAAMEKLDYDTALTYVSDTIVYTNIPIGPVEGPDAVPRLARAVLCVDVGEQVGDLTSGRERTDRLHRTARPPSLPRGLG